MIDWIALVIFAAGIIFVSGGLFIMIRILHRDVADIKQDLKDQNNRINTHDVVFESIAVNQKYIIRGIDRLEDDVQDIKKRQCED